jgi:hypothetical protein
MPTSHTWSLTVAGVDRTALVMRRSLRGTWTRGGRQILTLAFYDVRNGAPAYRPNEDEEVVLTIDGVVRSRCLINQIAETPLGGIAAGTLSAVMCVDSASVLDRITVTESYGNDSVAIANSSVANPTQITTMAPHGWSSGMKVRISGHLSSTPALDGDYTITLTGANTFTIPVNVTVAGGAGYVRRIWTLKEIFSDLVTKYLTANYGITLDAGMAAGPILDPVVIAGEFMESAMTRLTEATTTIKRVLPTKVLEVFALGTKTASFNLDGSNTSAPIQWQRSRRQFANRVIVFIGGTQKLVRTEVFASTGAAHDYVTRYPASADINDLWPNLLIVNGINQGPVAWKDDVSFAWYWDPVTHKLVNKGTGYNPAAGALITVTYTAQYPAQAKAENATDVQAPPTGRGPWEVRRNAPQYTELEQGQTLANQLLAALFFTASPRELQTASAAGYALPGDVLTLTFPDRLVSGTWAVESVSWSLWNRSIFYYEYAFTEGTSLQATWLDDVKTLTSPSTVTPDAPLIGAGGTSVPAPAVIASPVYLGGERTRSIALAAAAWMEIPNFVPFIATATFAGRIRCGIWARNAGVTVTARLWDATASVAAMTTSGVTSQVEVEVLASGTITAGHRYRLQILSSANNEGVYCGFGQLEGA